MGLHRGFISTWICCRAGTLSGVFQVLHARWDGDAAQEQGMHGAPMLPAPVTNEVVIAVIWGWGGHRCSCPRVMKSLGEAQGTTWSARAAEGSADVVHVLTRVLSALAGASALGTRKKIRVCSGNSIRRMFVCPSPSCPHTAALSLWINTLVKH